MVQPLASWLRGKSSMPPHPTLADATSPKQMQTGPGLPLTTRDLEGGNSRRSGSESSTSTTSSASSITLVDDEARPVHSWRRFQEWMCEDVHHARPQYILLVQSFSTAIVDVVTLLRFGTFVASQTGNLVILGMRIVDVPYAGKTSHCLVSLGGFCIGAFLTSLACRRYTPPFSPSSGCASRRWYQFLTFGMQAILLIIPAILWYIDAIDLPAKTNVDGRGAYLVNLWLMSISFGAQSANAKLICPKGRISPIPTIVISIAMADFWADPRLFSFSIPGITRRRPANWARNDRFWFIVTFFIGSLVGAAMIKRVHVHSALMLAASVEFLPLAFVAFAGVEPGKDDCNRGNDEKEDMEMVRLRKDKMEGDALRTSKRLETWEGTGDEKPERLPTRRLHTT